MSENVELKARLHDPVATLAKALDIGAVDEGTLSQRDTYYPARHGRLKLRELGSGHAELLAYDRSDTAEAKVSTYVRADANSVVGDALGAALGTRVIVAKQRHLLMFENVRIHIDQVEGLGSFLEFEAVLGPDDTRAAGEAKVAMLRSLLEITEHDLIAVGYADMLEASADHLRAAATDAVTRAYAPYSNFQVGAAIRGASGAIYAAGNVENASYSQTQCAEASAIGMMVAAGETRITAVAVASARLEVCTPCGGCRQRLSEFSGPDTPVYLGPETHTLGELLPMGFTL